jgi:hypothetical protein
MLPTAPESPSRSNKDTIDASFDESTDTPSMICSSEGFFDLIFRLKQRSLSLQKARQRSQSQF